MHQSARRHLAQLALTAACAAMPLGIIGCEKPDRQADRKVHLAIHQSDIAASKEGNESKAYTLLTQAAKTADASEVAKAHAKTLVAQADYAYVIKHLPALSDAEANASAIVDEIARLASQISANNLLIEQCKAANPVGVAPHQPQPELAKMLQKYTAQSANLDKLILAAGDRVRAKAADIAALTKQQTAAADEAASLLARSEQAAGQASLDLFKQSAEANTKADALTIALNKAKAELANLQLSSAEFKTRRQLAQAAAAAAQRQSTQLAAAWSKARQVMQATAANSGQLVNSKDGIAAKAKALAAALAAADEKRQVIDARLENAITNFTDAAKAADAVNADMRQRLNTVPSDSVERLAFQRMERLHNFAVHRLDRARALMARGGIYTAQKNLLESHHRFIATLTPILKQAALPLPAELNTAAIQKQIAAASKSAQISYENADQLLLDIIERGQPDDRDQAHFPRIGTQYALYTLTGKDTYLTEARSILKQVASATGDESAKAAKVIPALPAELEKDIVKRAAIDITVKPKPVGPATPDSMGREFNTWRKMLSRAVGSPTGPNAPAPETQPADPPAPQ